MRIKAWLPSLLAFSASVLASPASDFPRLTGPYLGQKPPGTTPELFAQEILTEAYALHGSPAFSPDGREIYWAPMENPGRKGKTDEILFMKVRDGKWTQPAVVPFSSTWFDSDDPCMSPDGRRIYFTTHRPSRLFSFDFREKIMYVEKEGDGWSSPKSVGGSVNSMFRHWQMSVNRNYDLYFHAEKNVSAPGLYVSRYSQGRYQVPQRLPAEINAGNPYHPCIAPDESYIIFVRTTQERGDDLFISFSSGHGGWTEAQNLGPTINSPSHDICPSVTPDGRYLFFLSQRHGGQGAYWVSTRFIDEMRPKKMPGK